MQRVIDFLLEHFATELDTEPVVHPAELNPSSGNLMPENTLIDLGGNWWGEDSLTLFPEDFPVFGNELFDS